MNTPQHERAIPALVDGVYDPNLPELQLPVLSAANRPDGTIHRVSQGLGELAFVGQCLEPNVAARVGHRPSGAALTDLAGSYAVIDTQKDEMTILADLSGQWPVFYTQSDGKTHYSTSMENVTSSRDYQIDRVALAQYIIGGDFLDPDRTAYVGVRRLPAGHKLTMSRSGSSLTEYATFTPDRSVKFRDAAAKIGEHLLQALDLRLASPGQNRAEELYFALSGGLDSTSLALLGASLLPKEQPLHAFHVQRPASQAGDTAYALSAARLDPRIRLHHLILSNAVMPYNELDRARPHYPFAHVEGVARETIETELAYLADCGAAGLVTGEGGDALFSPPPQYQADLMSRPIRNALRFARHASVSARAEQVAFLDVLKIMRAQSYFSYPESLRKIAAAIAVGESDPQLTWHTLTAEAVPLLSVGMRKQLSDVLYAKSKEAPSYAGMGVADFIAMRELRLSGDFTAGLRRFAGQHNMEITAPFLDNPVIKARSRLATHLAANPKQFKDLLRAALEAYVPPGIFARRTKGNHTAEEYQGIRANTQKLRTLFGKDCRLAALGVIDPNAFQLLITKAELGQEIALSALERAVSIELWLRQQPGFEERSAVATNYAQPMQTGVTEITPVIVDEALPLTVLVPPHVRLIENGVGVAAYNVRTQHGLDLHTKATLVLRAIQRRGLVADAASALRVRYPTINGNLLSQDLTAIVNNMLMQGILEAGEPEPFDIVTPSPRTNDAAGDTAVLPGKIDTSGVQLRDYLGVGRAILGMTKLVSKNDLFDAIQILADRKQGLPATDEESIRRLMAAGHVLLRYHVLRRFVCTDLTAATILAEARRGRAAQYMLLMAPDPNRYHAAPGTNGKPVQTAMDQVIEGNFSVIGTW